VHQDPVMSSVVFRRDIAKIPASLHAPSRGNSIVFFRFLITVSGKDPTGCQDQICGELPEKFLPRAHGFCAIM
jgi:hypothetical protein